MNKPDEALEFEPVQPNELRMETITDPSSPFLVSYQALMERTFPSEELDSLEVTQSALEESSNPNRRADFILITLLAPNGEVMGAMNASYIPAKSKEKENLGWGFTVVNYVVVDDRFKGHGLADKLYAALDERSHLLAQERGETLNYVVGETVPDPKVERKVNQTGRARLYYDNAGTKMEVPYYQACLEWEEDGSPQSEPVPLHLVAKPTTGGKTIKKADILRLVDGIYDYNSRENANAVPAHVDAVLTRLEQDLEGVEELEMISQEEREAVKARGVVFLEHQTSQNAHLR